LLGLMRSTLNLPKFGRENFDALMYIVRYDITWVQNGRRS
jgi:hypothetical protein